MARILIVEDEEAIAEAVAAYLARDGHEVLTEGDGAAAAELLLKEEFELIILDLMLPGLSGEELCGRIRSRSSIPVLMLTAKKMESDLIYGFRVGADDYMTKPFSPRELVVRVNALLRRSGGKAVAQILEFGDGHFQADMNSRILQKDGENLRLTAMEFNILEKLLSYPGRVFSREDIISSVMGHDFDGADRTVDSHIRNLRSKIEEDSKNPRYILTRRGIGFYFHG